MSHLNSLKTPNTIHTQCIYLPLKGNIAFFKGHHYHYDFLMSWLYLSDRSVFKAKRQIALG